MNYAKTYWTLGKNLGLVTMCKYRCTSLYFLLCRWIFFSQCSWNESIIFCLIHISRAPAQGNLFIVKNQCQNTGIRSVKCRQQSYILTTQTKNAGLAAQILLLCRENYFNRVNDSFSYNPSKFLKFNFQEFVYVNITHM